MGWFWDSRTPGTSTTEDPYSKLDPTLRDFLYKQSPVRNEEAPRSRAPPTTSTPEQEGAPPTFRAQLGLDTPGVSQRNQDLAPQENKPSVPPESLFPDGRHAHLWKNYRSLQELESRGKSDQDKLTDVIDAYNTRKAAIGRGAIENCVLEQMAERDCWSHGSFTKRLTMCRDESRAFNRCYLMQSRFLKALGYLSSETSREDEERVQMHADRLYHEMLERERVVEQAKKEGLEAPMFAPLIRNGDAQPALTSNDHAAPSRILAQQQQRAETFELSPEKRKQLHERLKGKSKQEQEIELQLYAAEQKAHVEYATKIKGYLEDEKQSRADRRERGKETVGDSIKRLWGWDR